MVNGVSFAVWRWWWCGGGGGGVVEEVLPSAVLPSFLVGRVELSSRTGQNLWGSSTFAAKAREKLAATVTSRLISS